MTYEVVDPISRNVVGEFESLADAEEYRESLEARGFPVGRLEISGGDT